MRDDFIALDLLSAGEFSGSSKEKRSKKKKKALFSFPRRHARGQKKSNLTTLLPRLAAKVKQPGAKGVLQGWPVSLSWPAEEELAPKHKSDLH